MTHGDNCPYVPFTDKDIGSENRNNLLLQLEVHKARSLQDILLEA